MAQTAWINIMLDGSTATSSDPGKWRHGILSGPALSGAATFSWDPNLLNSANIMKSVIETISARTIGGGGLK
jgi:hypothetical protein